MIRNDISLSDPAILADPVSNTYYMTGTGGDIFKSANLEVWTKLDWALHTSDIAWVGVNHTAPHSGQIWAPELYYKDGAYYNVVTFTNPDAKTEGTNHTRRSIHILKSDRPEGPFKKIQGGDELYLPASKMAIDGTIWEEDGHLYLVYCYEWVQAGDGAIEFIELKSDLSGTIGSSTHICKASDGRAWNTDAVTDGPFLFRTQTGRLGMIWTCWRSGIYVQGVAYSDNGKLNGKWSHSKCPITPDNYGHGMLFRTFDGQLLMSIHSHRNIDLANQHFERHPELFVMDDSSDEMRAVMQYKYKYDLTSPSQVVVLNSGFDYSTTAWVNTCDASSRNIADNQGGTISGKYYESWDANSFTGEIYQELKVPNGTYRLTASVFRSFPVQGAMDDNSAVCLFANGDECDVTSPTPQDFSVTTYVADGKLKIGLRSNKKNYQWMGLDNVKVTYYGEDRIAEETIDAMLDGEDAVYLMNKKTETYLNCGGSWGTQALVSDCPLDLYPIELPNGKYVIDTHIRNGSTNHYLGAGGYLDAAMTELRIKMIDSVTCVIHNGVGYFGTVTGSNVVKTDLTSSASAASRWIMKRKSDLLGEFTMATPEAPVNATFLLKGANFGRNDLRVGYWSGQLGTGGDVTNQCAQAPSEAYDVYQILKDIPNGFYEVSVQGFYRDGTATVAANRRSNGREKLNAYMYANEMEQPLMSVFEFADNVMIPSAEAEETKLGKIPATLNAVSVMFSSGLYKQSLIVEVIDGTLRVGVRKTEGALPADNWTAFDHFELFYL
ncbi:MAG: family 43 glycosylhydrolase, partial [Paraprevotella sp.]|nr:family 43 glycosylhydrolase [Paraprevotella sp.]